MPRAARTCSTCPTIITTGTRCHTCTTRADRQRRPNGNPYGAAHRRFAAAVIARDPTCTRCHAAPSTTADHHPTSRRDLETAGQDPNDPRHGRGLCTPCHNIETANHQPGGWNAERIATTQGG